MFGAYLFVLFSKRFFILTNCLIDLSLEDIIMLLLKSL